MSVKKFPPKADQPRAEKILIVGAGGGREHAIGWKVAQSSRAGKLFFARGNAGTAQLGINLDIKETDISALIKFAKEEKIDLTLALSDDPLALGIVDEFQAENLRIWGPTKAASELEWSKAYAKDFMRRHNLPTAKYEVFSDFEKAKKYLTEAMPPYVIKASGLALGKGVVIAQNKNEALETLENMMIKKVFGASGEEVVIEEYLSGTEISIHAVSDGKNYKIFPASQDHKCVFDNDTGPNTGGMGVITPLPFVDEALMTRIEKEIVAPTISGMTKEGRSFAGILYPGIMLTSEGPKVFEFNARFGDPEAESYMRLLETDILDIFDACIDGTVKNLQINWSQKSACTIMLASGGYPGSYEKGKEIYLPSSTVGRSSPPNLGGEEGVVLFHAGTKMENGRLVTNGGRVLGVSAVGENLEQVLATAYDAVSKIKFEGMQYRKDIGKKAIEFFK